MYRFVFAFFLGLLSASAQVSADCNNAVPICSNTPVNGGTDGFGIDDFDGTVKSGCLERTITDAIESNSAWYRFRTGASGQLGFNISINTLEDWDFALYRTSDCNDLGEPIRCNFYDNQSRNSFLGVGEDPTGDTENNQYQDWINVAPGEDYYLLLNNFSNSNSGFSIQFSGQIFITDPYTALDCSIVSNLLGPPITTCQGNTVVLDATTANAVTYNWFQDVGSGFLSIVGENNPTLSVLNSGFYRVEVITTTSDNIVSDVQVGFSIMPLSEVISDAIACSDPLTYDLEMKDAEVLGSQNPNDFVVSYHSSLVDAVNNSNVLSRQFESSVGSNTIFVRVTSLDNANCYDVSQQFQLTGIQTPVLDFPDKAYICDGDESLTVGSLGTMPNYTYLWNSGETTSSILVTEEGEYTVEVAHTLNGISCVNSKTVKVSILVPPTIVNIEIDDLHSNNTVTIFSDIEGDWEYQLDNDAIQNENIFRDLAAGVHTVTLSDPRGCGSVSEQFVIVGFPEFFTPNGDGVHDFWGIDGVENLIDPIVTIYDRYGSLIKQMNGTAAGWDGTLNGKTMPATDYWFKLSYIDGNGQQIQAKYVNSHFSLKR